MSSPTLSQPTSLFLPHPTEGGGRVSGWVDVWPLAKPPPPHHGAEYFPPQTDCPFVRAGGSRRESVRGSCNTCGKLPSTRRKVCSRRGSWRSPWAKSLLFCCCEASRESCFSRTAGSNHHQTAPSPSASSALRRMPSWQPVIYSQHLAPGRELTPRPPPPQTYLLCAVKDH